MILRIVMFLATLSSSALASPAWDPRWNKFRNPIAGWSSGTGSGLLIALASGWITFISGFIMAASIVAVIWGATTMQGVAIDEGNKENGKKIIIGALTGLVLSILALAIVNFVDVFISPANFPVCPSGGGPGCP